MNNKEDKMIKEFKKCDSEHAILVVTDAGHKDVKISQRAINDFFEIEDDLSTAIEKLEKEREQIEKLVTAVIDRDLGVLREDGCIFIDSALFSRQYKNV